MQIKHERLKICDWDSMEPILIAVTTSTVTITNIIKSYKKNPQLFIKIISLILFLSIGTIVLLVWLFVSLIYGVVNIFKFSPPVAAALVSGVFLVLNGNFIFLKNQQLVRQNLELQKAEKKQDEMTATLGELRGTLNHILLLDSKAEGEKIEEMICNLIKNAHISGLKEIANRLEKVAQVYKRREKINHLIYEIRDDVIQISNEFNSKKEQVIKNTIFLDNFYNEAQCIYEALFSIEEKIVGSSEAAPQAYLPRPTNSETST